MLLECLYVPSFGDLKWSIMDEAHLLKLSIHLIENKKKHELKRVY